MKLASSSDVGHVWFEKLWNERDESVAYDLMSPDCRGYLEGNHEIVGPGAFIEFQRGLLSTIPDLKLEVVATAADNDDVCVHWRATGTHTGDGFGLAPTGRSLAFQGVTWFKLADGKIIGGQDFWNLNALMETLSGSPETVVSFR